MNTDPRNQLLVNTINLAEYMAVTKGNTERPRPKNSIKFSFVNNQFIINFTRHKLFTTRKIIRKYVKT